MGQASLASTRTKATVFPSVETCGSALQTNFAMSVSAIRRLAGAAGCETFNCTEGGILFGANVPMAALETFVAGGGRP